MNNSFARLIDGVNTVLRDEALSRINDVYARSQLFGVINLLNTFKVRADWSAGFLLQQVQAQQTALAPAAAAAAQHGGPAVALAARPAATPMAELLALREAQNAAMAELLQWAEAQGREAVAAPLRQALREEMDIELKHSPRPMFAEMSGEG